MGMIQIPKKMRTSYKFISSHPNNLDIIFYFITLFFCYIFFNQGDLLHTGGSSFTYLDGHIRDFYEVNKDLMGGNNYLPSTYILYAIWNLPMKLLGIQNQATMDAGCVLFWYKLLTTLFLAGSAYFMYKIGGIIGLNKKNSILLTIIWISSPILFFSQFIFGGCDIFYTFFVLVGLYHYLKKNMWLFILFFSISFTFKYFPLLVFIPLLLRIEKNPLKMLGYSLLSLIPVALEVLFYNNAPAFNSGVFGFSALERIYISQISIFPNVSIYLFLFLWFIICGICYYVPPVEEENENTFYQKSFYVCLAVSCLTFILVFWHPQWLLFMTPFLAVTTFMNKRIKDFLLFDFLIMIPFIGFTVIFWKMNVDQQMIGYGVLGMLEEINPDFIKHFFAPDKSGQMASLFMFGFVPHTMNVYFTIFAAILILNALFKFPNKGNAWEGNDNLVSVKEYWNYARLRFFGGMAVFIIPALIAFFYTFIKYGG
jgi:hypothetical protein